MKRDRHLLPRLVPRIPTHAQRITLTPQQTVALWKVLEDATTAYDKLAEQQHPAGQKRAYEVFADIVWELEAKVSDKLDFVRADATGHGPAWPDTSASRATCPDNGPQSH